MSELLVQNKEIVVPGEVVAKGMEYLPSDGTYRRGDEIVANRVGLLRVDGKILKSTPQAGPYAPQKDDVVIGQVTDILMTGWRVNLNGPNSSVLNMKDTKEFIPKGADLTKFFDIDDYMVCKVTQVTSQNLIDITVRGPGLFKLRGGRIVKVIPAKVRRIIGRQDSMIEQIKKATGCRINVGTNGLIWLEGDPAKENIAVQIFRLIEQKAHLPGLTDLVQKELETLMANLKQPRAQGG